MRTPHRPRRIAAVLAATAALLTLAATAQAWTPPSPDPGTPQSFVDQVGTLGLLDDTPTAWAPGGAPIPSTITGFDPEVDGFRFLNYSDGENGLPNLVNTYWFDVPYEDPVDLTPADMRTMFGAQVCTNATGPCQLTLAAEEWMVSANQAMDGGHCFGIAGTAAQLFNGSIRPSAIGSIIRPPYRTPWSSTMTRTIARNMAFQFTRSMSGYAHTPAQAVQQLIEDLTPDSAPYIMAIFETSGHGGHAITPIAVNQTGDGLYDIVVWDNNYPGRTRAVHIDANANTMSYEMFTVPGEPATMASGNVWLVPASDLLGQQNCPFCTPPSTTSTQTARRAQPGRDTTVMIEAVEITASERVIARVRGLDGRRIRGLRTIPPLSPSDQGMQSFPTFVVPAGVPFQVVLSTRSADRRIETGVRAHSGERTWIVDDLTVRPGSIERVAVNPRAGSVSHRSSRGTDPSLAIIDHDPTSDESYRIEARNLETDRGDRSVLRLDAARDTAILTTSSRARDRIVIAATAEDDASEIDRYAWTSLPRRGERLVISFSGWSAARRGALEGVITGARDSATLNWTQRITRPPAPGTGGVLPRP